MNIRWSIIIALLTISGFANVAQASDYFNGFEVDTENWFDLTRVPTGNGGIASASGSFHAITDVGPNPFTRWGGYNDDPACAGGGACTGVFPPDGYDTSIDIYLDVDGGYANDTGFDFDSAVYQPNGSFRRDFIFNCGFYNDDTDSGGNGTPGAGVNRFICSASNNSQPGSAYAKNPGRAPTVVATTTGWYTFRHQFRDDGSGVLTVDLSVLNAVGTVIKTWTLSDPTDLIGTTVGGNGYGWMDFNELGELALDNTLRTSIVSAQTLTCSGFYPPFDAPMSVRKKVKKALPLKFNLSDEFGNEITDSDLVNPPVVQIMFGAFTGNDIPGYEGDLLPNGLSDDGNLFRYDSESMQWILNLGLKAYTASGEYTISVVAGDDTYVIDGCSQTFTRQ